MTSCFVKFRLHDGYHLLVNPNWQRHRATTTLPAGATPVMPLTMGESV